MINLIGININIMISKDKSPCVFIAKGDNRTSKRVFIGVDVCNNENGTNRSLFFQGLAQRGYKGVHLVISDAHSGLVAGY